jgi:hypothetical protein
MRIDTFSAVPSGSYLTPHIELGTATSSIDDYVEDLIFLHIRVRKGMRMKHTVSLRQTQ